jgi:hypothetical protein
MFRGNATDIPVGVQKYVVDLSGHIATGRVKTILISAKIPLMVGPKAS